AGRALPGPDAAARRRVRVAQQPQPRGCARGVARKAHCRRAWRRRRRLTPDTRLSRWGLVADGEAIETASSLLLPVRRGDMTAVLKIARDEEERRGGWLMAWWNGDGAARVLAHDEQAILLERLAGPRSLAAMVAAGEDDEATRI